MKTHQFVAAAILLLVSRMVHATPDLSARLEAILRDTHTTGAGIAIIRRGVPPQLINLGSADLAGQVPVSSTTTFRTASAGKMFTTLAVLRLVEDGRLDLDAPLRAVAPEVAFANPWEAVAPVRIVHLLEHTTGWDDLHPAEYAYDNAAEVPVAATLALHPDSRNSRWMPGTRMSYSNSGPAVAGYVVEKISGKRFEDFVAETMFRPLGMASATYFQDTAHGATGYDATGKRALPFAHILYRPAGSTSVSVADMAKLVRMFLNRGMVDGRQVFQPASIERMEHARTSIGARAGLEAGPGMGMLDRSYGGHRWYGHSGDIDGGHASIWYQPQAGVGVVAMINSDTADALEKIMQTILPSLLVTRSPDPPAPLSSASWKGVDGWYVLSNPRSQLARAGLIFGALQLRYEPDMLLRSRPFGAGLDNLELRGQFAIDPRTAVPYGVRAHDPIAGDVVVFGSQVHQRVSLLRYATSLTGLLSLILMSVLALSWCLVWVPRWLLRKMDGGPAIAIRTWPLLATVLLLAVMASIVLVQPPETTLGLVTPFSVWIMVASAAYGMLGIVGAVTVIHLRKLSVRRGVRWFCAVHAGLHLVAAIYLAWYGFIGFRTWA